MCIYSKLIQNKKYTETAKNGGIIPTVYDERTLYVPWTCGNCIECRKQKAREWELRLTEEVEQNKNGIFVTLTFSDESIKKLNEKVQTIRTDKNGYEYEINGYNRDNRIATKGVRYFTENWRKRYNDMKEMKHWLITELGHENTKNIHLHGIIWTKKGIEAVRERWKWGWVYPRNEEEKKLNYVNGETVGYCVKYVHKIDEEHPNYKPKILSSKGIGKVYTDGIKSKINTFRGKDTVETYRTNTGHKINMPIYWKNKIYSDKEREELWIKKMDEGIRWVRGEKINIKNGTEEYEKAIARAREINTIMGYGSDKRDEEKIWYENEERDRLRNERIKRATEWEKEWEKQNKRD